METKDEEKINTSFEVEFLELGPEDPLVSTIGIPAEG